jgi:hypothetical protein
MKPDYSLPERAAILLEYWLLGKELYWEWRRFIMLGLAVGAMAEVLKFNDGQEPSREETIIGVNMSLTRFLTMLNSMQPADFTRMEQVIRYEKEMSK